MGILPSSLPACLSTGGLLATLSAIHLMGCGAPQVSGFRVVETYPHDPRAYTQGFLYADGSLFESTGRRGTSSVRRVSLETGVVERSVDLPGNLFGEGLAQHGDELFQLTWTDGIAHVFDLATLKVKRQHRYDGEGWGLTSDGRHLIQSDGTDVLTFRDPETFEQKRRLRVRSNGQPLRDLNELEFIEGQIWANLWKHDQIARIDPESGEVVGWVDLTGLFDASGINDEDAVLNGIAWDGQGRRLFVTGKLWPKVFEIEVTD